MENHSRIEITHIIQLLVGYPPNIAMENPSYKPPFIHVWLVVSTPLKNMSQWEGWYHILWKIKHVLNHQPDVNFRIFSGFSQSFPEIFPCFSQPMAPFFGEFPMITWAQGLSLVRITLTPHDPTRLTYPALARCLALGGARPGWWCFFISPMIYQKDIYRIYKIYSYYT